VSALRIFIGHDKREKDAYLVAEASIRRRSSMAVSVPPLDVDRLASSGLLRRPTDRRCQIYDIHSNAPASTDFHASRFMVPHLAQSGWALFVDCDVVFLADVAELFDQADSDKAVMVVKHGPISVNGMKMDGQPQLAYPRKNWSSVILWNCDHPANWRLSLQDVNERPGRDLHQFYWLHDSEIGELSSDWNWLVGCQPKPKFPKVAHFTSGGPWIKNWQPAEHDDLWLTIFNSL